MLQMIGWLADNSDTYLQITIFPYPHVDMSPNPHSPDPSYNPFLAQAGAAVAGRVKIEPTDDKWADLAANG